MSKKAILLIIAAVVVIALVWLGVSRSKSADVVVASDDAEVVEEVVEVEAQVAEEAPTAEAEAEAQVAE